MKVPDTQYAKIGGSYIGYQVAGEGPIDLVYVAGMTTHLELQWEYPPLRRMLERYASFSRLILFDPRGVGISDPAPREGHTSWEYWVQDLQAVLEAAASERAVIHTNIQSSYWGLLQAATHPEQTTALVLWCPYARYVVADDYPIGFALEVGQAAASVAGQLWGTPALARWAGGTEADEETARWLARYARSAMTPGAAAALIRETLELDARHVLPTISAPTLVVHPRDYQPVPPAFGRYIAERIPGARFVEVPGSDTVLSNPGREPVWDLIEDFLADVRHAAEPDRLLATVLFTDIVGSTDRAAELGDRKWKELLGEHDRLSRQQIERFRGTVVGTTGDGILATFDGPGRAIRCAHALGRALRSQGIDIRTGLHTGEIELREGDDIGGIAVHIAARVMAEAGPGEVVCSRTVKDLVAGSEFAFENRGVRTLKGVPDEWQLYAVTAS